MQVYKFCFNLAAQKSMLRFTFNYLKVEAWHDCVVETTIVFTIDIINKNKTLASMAFSNIQYSKFRY